MQLVVCQSICRTGNQCRPPPLACCRLAFRKKLHSDKFKFRGATWHWPGQAPVAPFQLLQSRRGSVRLTPKLRSKLSCADQVLCFSGIGDNGRAATVLHVEAVHHKVRSVAALETRLQALLKDRSSGMAFGTDSCTTQPGIPWLKMGQSTDSTVGRRSLRATSCWKMARAGTQAGTTLAPCRLKTGLLVASNRECWFEGSDCALLHEVHDASFAASVQPALH